MLPLLNLKKSKTKYMSSQISLSERIEQMRVKTYEIMSLNPDIKEVQWELRDIPYKEYEKLRELNPDTKNNYHGDNLMFFIISDYPRGFQVCVWSGPVKIKHTYEVIEN